MSQVSPIFPKNYVGIADASSVGFDPKTPGSPGQEQHRAANRRCLPALGQQHGLPRRLGHVLQRGAVRLRAELRRRAVRAERAVLHQPEEQPAGDLPARVPGHRHRRTERRRASRAAQNPNYKTPYSMQYNFTIERQQWNTGFRVSYIGTAMRKGALCSTTTTRRCPNSQPFIDKPRPFPNFPDIWYVTNGAGHQYNGLTVEALRHLRPAGCTSRVRGPGRAIATIWTTTGTSTPGSSPRRIPSTASAKSAPRRRSRPTGSPPTSFTSFPSARAVTLRSSISQARQSAGRRMGDQRHLHAQTGMFLTPFWTGDDPVGITYTDRATPASVTIRPNIVTNPNCRAHTIEQWFEPECVRAARAWASSAPRARA